MKKLFVSLFVALIAVMAVAQNRQVLDDLKADPRKAYGNDYPYPFVTAPQTKAPKGYKPFYISHYSRHGSRYYWNEFLYRELDKLLTTAHERRQLTSAGEAFFEKFMAAKQEQLHLGLGAQLLKQLEVEGRQCLRHLLALRALCAQHVSLLSGTCAV